jgi:hypothetical protein
MVPNFRDEMYWDVKTPGYNVRGHSEQGLNVQGRIIPDHEIGKAAGQLQSKSKSLDLNNMYMFLLKQIISLSHVISGSLMNDIVPTQL